IILAPSSATLAMLSASISNPQEIAEWLKDVRGKECRVIIKTERPVPLRYGFIHPDMGVIPLEDEKGRILHEVRDFYGNTGLDAESLKLKMPNRRDGNLRFRKRDR
ncbi:MAG: hypothetical protein SGJ02_06875, partial [bacterium]|nr:hypothetical protein [bacterium]